MFVFLNLMKMKNILIESFKDTVNQFKDDIIMFGNREQLIITNDLKGGKNEKIN